MGSRVGPTRLLNLKKCILGIKFRSNVDEEISIYNIWKLNFLVWGSHVSKTSDLKEGEISQYHIATLVKLVMWKERLLHIMLPHQQNELLVMWKKKNIPVSLYQ